MIVPTRWPLLQIFIQIWKLSVSTAFFRPSAESLTYEYTVLIIRWGGKELYRFRLYDSEKRRQSRLNQLLEASEYTKDDLFMIIAEAKKYIEDGKYK